MYKQSVDSGGTWNQIGTGFQDISAIGSGGLSSAVGVTNDGKVMRKQSLRSDIDNWNQIGSGFEKASTYLYGVIAIKSN